MAQNSSDTSGLKLLTHIQVLKMPLIQIAQNSSRKNYSKFPLYKWQVLHRRKNRPDDVSGRLFIATMARVKKRNSRLFFRFPRARTNAHALFKYSLGYDATGFDVMIIRGEPATLARLISDCYGEHSRST